MGKDKNAIKIGIVELEITKVTGIGKAVQMNNDVEPIKGNK